MLTLKHPILLGAVLLGGLTANAQNGVVLGQSAWPQIQDPNAPSPTASNRSNQPTGYARLPVDAFGNVVRPASQLPLSTTPSMAAMLANQAIIGSSTNANSVITHGSTYGNSSYGNRGGGYGYNNYGYGYGNNNYGGYGNVTGGYCPPAYPAPAPAYCPPTYPAPYPYPYAYPTNNYYYPAAPYTVQVGSRPDWAQGATVTGLPTVGFAAPAYPAPAYPYPYPYPYPASQYPYNGTTTYITGGIQGSITTQSRSSGYGVSVGRNGVSAQATNRNYNSSTYITTR